MSGYNPMQYQLDSLDNQIQMLNQRRAMLQQQMQPAPIQQTFIQQPAPAAPATTFDFNGKWVNGIDEAKQLAGNNLPLLIFDKSSSIFYMKQLDGSMLAYEYKPVPITDPKDAEIKQLKQQLAEMQNQIKAVSSSLTAPSEEPKTTKRGGVKHE